MEKIKFSTKDYKVEYRSEEIIFLPKEFQLFKFLYHNPSRVFTRDELLDAVWPMETPIDRTIDDHIYRVRKKLKPLASVISIATVRGQGYLLSINEVQENPLIKDQEVSSSVINLFKKYHLYGQGNALKLLDEHQAMLGFKVDLPILLYLHFMKGDFSWFLEQKDIPFWEKCYYYLHIYSFIELDKKKCLDYFTYAIAAKELPEYHRLEITLLNRLSLLIFTKQIDDAINLLIQSKKVIYTKKIDSFIPILSITEGYLAFIQGDIRLIEESLDEIKKILLKYPYLREKASYSVLEGIYYLAKNNEDKAEHCFNDGFQLFREAKYIPGVLINMNIILFFLKELKMKDSLYTHYQELWEKYTEEYKLLGLKNRIEFELNSYLR
ncbi:hypothetical protein CYL18_07365 [Pradoshia eiseniae]|uniref:OmpR/PhoB-type domain-containing protein n=1 Tax=Pradoshia eiseniae TaxID=2064768 RepID=A0A2S7N112_9BACI|nr:winged helix-turn-helix domain-containing protein [Pradoshia eiseniae]PQD95703.1 hypothetical protein CYL18_07365 [Pradoshia eiseniae]